jgi:hypothetical protein
VLGLTFAAQVPPHAWKFALHVMPHFPPAQVALPLAAVGQVFEHAPQSSSDVIRSTHWLPQSVGAAPPHPVAHANPVPDGLQSGASDVHAALHEPQWAGSERSVSQPLAGF